MKISNQQLKEICDMADRFLKLNSIGLLNLYDSYRGIHLKEQAFRNTFKEYDVGSFSTSSSGEPDNEYAYCLKAQAHGHDFFCLSEVK